MESGLVETGSEKVAGLERVEPEMLRRLLRAS